MGSAEVSDETATASVEAKKESEKSIARSETEELPTEEIAPEESDTEGNTWGQRAAVVVLCLAVIALIVALWYKIRH